MGLDGLKSPYHATNNRTTLVRKRKKERKIKEKEGKPRLSCAIWAMKHRGIVWHWSPCKLYGFKWV